MLILWRKTPDRIIPTGYRVWRLLLMAAGALACETSIAGDGLWVDNPEEIAFSVADMTSSAKDMGLSNESFAATLSTMLNHAGLRARQSSLERDSDMLFLDVIVEDETFYASLGFWRVASYRQPDGELNSELVTVWQDYSVGAHHDDPGKVLDTVNKFIARFIARYRDVNNVSTPFRVASTP